MNALVAMILILISLITDIIIAATPESYIRTREFSVLVSQVAGGSKQPCVDDVKAIGRGQTVTYVCQQPITGRYVTLALYTQKPEILNFCELEVMAVPTPVDKPRLDKIPDRKTLPFVNLCSSTVS